MKEKRFSAMGALLLALGLLLCIGAATFMHPCRHEDETVSTCYWAGQMIVGIGAVLSVQALGLLLVKNAPARCALAFSMTSVAILALLTPGTLIRLCMMASMRCNSVMKPGTMVLSLIILVLAAGDAVKEGMRAAKARKERHES